MLVLDAKKKNDECTPNQEMTCQYSLRNRNKRKSTENSHKEKVPDHRTKKKIVETSLKESIQNLTSAQEKKDDLKPIQETTCNFSGYRLRKRNYRAGTL